MSDYTPPTLVIPTPGGNPGDGSLNGALTVQANISGPTNTVLLQYGSNLHRFITLDGSGDPVLAEGTGGYIRFGSGGKTYMNDSGIFTIYNNVSAQGLGLAPIYGDDVRTGLTAADSAAKTLYTTTAAGQLYRLMGRILATAGTSPSATYTIKWTEGGATITKTLTISALDSDSDLSILIQPDNGTAITAQLTAISGTGTTVNVAATVEQMA